MGNRAVITTKAGWKHQTTELGVYLHWNGGRDSVEAFLAYCKLKGYRPPEQDNYGWSYLCQVLCNFFGDGMCCGIDIVSRLDKDNWDNGVYIIENWEIVGREFKHGLEQSEYKLLDMLLAIDGDMPEKQRIGEAAIREYCKSRVENTDGRLSESPCLM